MDEREFLKRRQAAGADVEQKMIRFLVQYEPAFQLKIADVRQIATSARLYFFESFDKLDAPFKAVNSVEQAEKANDEVKS